jgi:hypothetical protein
MYVVEIGKHLYGPFDSDDEVRRFTSTFGAHYDTWKVRPLKRVIAVVTYKVREEREPIDGIASRL